ncbi:hypothetical protein SH591_01975 [Sphingomonas sp. LY54]|uniref:hypothetical protein n=1 Tax=Sphingomonas sp. LY54 TaxID=3095343 RepID=UPI002D78D78B|nr:hypothetical protein [Sphingomonas sp. LY54]WRP28974.1 hypothetical protein SH591_01975 [Sphingomonas sp. LY54]
MPFEGEDEFSWFLRLLPLGLALGFGALLLLRASPPPPPANSLVFGCYANPHAAAILLNATGMHIRQGGFPAIAFHLQRHKTGISLVAEAPIRADRTAQGYQFAIDRRGIGRFLDFYREQDGRVYGVFDEGLLEGFQMLATDGARLNYQPADVGRCVAD